MQRILLTHMPGQKRIRTEYRNIYYNVDTGKYDVKHNYKEFNVSKQRNDYKSKWKYNIATLDEAKIVLKKMLMRKENEQQSGVTLQCALELWKNKAAAQGYSKITIANTDYYMKMLGEVMPLDTKICDITEEMSEYLFSKCREKYSDETIRTLNATFRKLVNLAYKKQLVLENPLARADNVKAKRTDKIRILTPEEWKRIDLYFCENDGEDLRYRLLFNLLYYTGIRIGECLALTRQDFERMDMGLLGQEKQLVKTEAVQADMEKERIQENKSQKMRLNISKTILQDGTLANRTKNKKNRKIPLTSTVIKLYLEDVQTQYGDNVNRVFGGTYNMYASSLSAACKKIGIPHCSCHSFRHTFISNLMRKGVPLPVIEKVSGDTQKTIFERYSHMFDDDEQMVLDALTGL